jgi:hypothetical protein
LDNLSKEKIVENLKDNIKDSSRAIIHASIKAAIDKNLEDKWKEDGCYGGKEDDMTVIVSKVL